MSPERKHQGRTWPWLGCKSWLILDEHALVDEEIRKVAEDMASDADALAAVFEEKK